MLFRSPDTLKSYTIKLANTTATALTTTFQAPVFSTVYGPVDYKPTLSKVNVHPFSTPFYWNGTSNLLIDICFTNGVYGNVAYQTYNSTTTFASSTVFQQDYPAGMIACTQATGTSAPLLRPNMIFSKDSSSLVKSNKIVMQRLVPSAAAISVTASTGNDTICGKIGRAHV